MPNILDELAAQQRAILAALDGLTAEVRANALPVCPMTADEEVWADGAMTVKQAAAFLSISTRTLFTLISAGELVSAMDGRRLIAKRGCVRYLLAHQETAHVGAR